ncbi:Transcriptional activator of fatty acid utilization [Sporothrix bragantina]|uniref:Transcriptional activator of fatty acid utilization n=1 Tax=Sporothrix bragantina TaxID=671064 RepID=A0ABP0AM70_9PEZI
MEIDSVEDSAPAQQPSSSPSIGAAGQQASSTQQQQDPNSAQAAANHLSFRSERGDVSEEKSPRASSVAASNASGQTPATSIGTGPAGFVRPPAIYHTAEGTPSSAVTELQAKQQEADNSTYVNLLMKPRFTRAPITEAGRVAYLGESSNLTLLVHDQAGSTDVVHYPLPENVRGSRARLTELDNVEIEILHQRGAFLLPPRDLCDELIEAYFKWVHPIVPVINRTRFMRQYRDTNNPPSLLLLQAVLLAGSRVCKNPKLMDANGSTTPAALTFYKRAKALYDANYEDDRVTIVQSLLLMGWYWEGPEDVTKNVFYWSRVATIVAQGSGMHRSVEDSQLSTTDKRLWKRIWWTLFTRDRSVAVALGRPVHINLEDSDVEMLVEEDFNEDEPDQPSEYPPDPLQVHFFMQYVKLCEIMGLVLSQQYSVASKGRQKSPMDLTHSDMALADWLQNCPPIVCWNASSRNFWSGLLFSTYYTTLCLLHRAYMPPGSSRFGDDTAMYPSRTIAFQAANNISAIIDYMTTSEQLRFCPAFIVYSLFSALIMHVYQMRSPIPSIQLVTQDNLQICMNGLKEVSKVWLVGKMVYALFESILGNRMYEDRLRRAGQRHHRMQQSFTGLEQHAAAQQHAQQHAQRQAQQQAQQAQQQAQQQQFDFSKRKYDDMAIDFSVNTPQPQESYERSRPQTPSVTAAKVEPGSGATMPPPASSITSPPTKQAGGDTFMGGNGPSNAPGGGGTASRPQTRPHTPFNPSYSVPATPPDLYLVTRNSPILSQSVWENFQPDQLFPDGTGFSTMFPPTMSPGATTQTMDPSMISSGMSQGQGQPQQSPFGQHITPVPPGEVSNNGNGNGGSLGGPNASPMQNSSMLAPGMPGFQQGNGAQQWNHKMDATLPDGQSPSDSWSTGSVGGQPVPSTLNVEDWFQFFGINGDVNAMNLDLSSLT